MLDEHTARRLAIVTGASRRRGIGAAVCRALAQRLARSVRPAMTGQVTVRLFGVPAAFALSLGLATA